MARATIVFWRDIPAQVIVGKGRAAAKVQLPERFEQAIDRAAMRAGARDQDAYLAEWRRADGGEVDGEAARAAQALADALDAAHPPDALRRLVENQGHRPDDQPSASRPEADDAKGEG